MDVATQKNSPNGSGMKASNGISVIASNVVVKGSGFLYLQCGPSRTQRSIFRESNGPASETPLTIEFRIPEEAVPFIPNAELFLCRPVTKETIRIPAVITLKNQ